MADNTLTEAMNKHRGGIGRVASGSLNLISGACSHALRGGCASRCVLVLYIYAEVVRGRVFMKFRGLLFIIGLLGGSVVYAGEAGDAGMQLAQRSVCMSCHQVDAKRVGPSMRDIALRYAGNDGAADYLATRIREGSRGLWGAIPMPAQRHIDPATALLLGEWIVSLAPETDVTGDDAPPAEDAPATQADASGAVPASANSGHQAANPESPEPEGIASP